KFKLESGLKKAAGHDAAALEDQFWLGSQEKHANGQERRGRRQTVRHLPGLAKRDHKLAVGERIGRGEINGAVDLLMFNKEFERAGEVGLVNPGNILAAVPLPPAEAGPHQTRQHGKDTARLRAENE